MKSVVRVFCACAIAASAGSSCSVDELGAPESGSAEDIAAQRPPGPTSRALFHTAAGPMEFTYELVDGYAIAEGDIILAGPDDAKGIDATWSTGRSVLSYRWPNSVVPYAIDPALPNKGRVFSAIAHWEANTNLVFVSATTSTGPDYVRFTPSNVCASYVGRQGGAQSIELAPGCNTGTVIHEIGHAVGLWHEQSRVDRDNTVTIHWDNIQAGREHNFETYAERGHDGFDHGAYDLASRMHYGPFAFSRNGQATITRTDGSVFVQQTNVLSAGDIAGVHHMYPNPCQPTTCNELGHDFGVWADGCGGTIDCNSPNSECIVELVCECGQNACVVSKNPCTCSDGTACQCP